MEKFKKHNKKHNINHVFIFPGTDNVNLIKSVGMISYYFYKINNFNSTILTDPHGNYPYYYTLVRGIKLKFIDQYKRINLFGRASIFKFLLFNSRKIDILSIMHLNASTVKYGALYKLLKRNGILYIKLDADHHIKQGDLFEKKYYYKVKSPWKLVNYWIDIFSKKIFEKRFNLMSIETRELCDWLKQTYNQYKDKFIYIPNGFDDNQLKYLDIKRKSFEQKENIIITVGRIGSDQKRTEVLLDAISKIKDLKDWKVLLIGPIENVQFIEYFNNFLEKNPSLENTVYMTGEITDRKELFEYYQKSKIFCLTSYVESFGIVLVEAGYFGNFLVSTNLYPVRDITKNGTIGKLFKIGDSDELAKILEELINNEDLLRENFLKIQEHIDKNFLWRNIVKKLYQEIYISNYSQK